MFANKKAALAAMMAAAFATGAWAQDSTAMATDCESQFTALDADANGFLSDVEAPNVYARARVDEMTVQASGISKAEFLTQCNAENWAQHTPEAGAPFEGANSFTEEQARDRAMAWNVSDVSALVQDEQGIWRGMGKLGGDAVSVAVDYKGNVVTAPKP